MDRRLATKDLGGKARLYRHSWNWYDNRPRDGKQGRTLQRQLAVWIDGIRFIQALSVPGLSASGLSARPAGVPASLILRDEGRLVQEEGRKSL
jgi:hypothetical protein